MILQYLDSNIFSPFLTSLFCTLGAAFGTGIVTWLCRNKIKNLYNFVKNKKDKDEKPILWGKLQSSSEIGKTIKIILKKIIEFTSKNQIEMINNLILYKKTNCSGYYLNFDFNIKNGDINKDELLIGSFDDKDLELLTKDWINEDLKILNICMDFEKSKKIEKCYSLNSEKIEKLFQFLNVVNDSLP